MRLIVEKTLSATPEAIWPHICVPGLMNAWSEATVELVDLGDGDFPWSTGTVRRVKIEAFGRQTTLLEVIERADPPHALVYRVVGGLPVRDHRGEMTLTPDGDQTHLSWSVEADFLVGAMAIPARVVLKRQLGQSMEALARCVEGAQTTVELRRSPQPTPEEDLDALYKKAEAALSWQQGLARQLHAQGEAKLWFTLVYALVTETLVEACRKGRFVRPGWVLRLVTSFDAHYISNLMAWQRGDTDAVETHWAEAFGAMTRADEKYPDPLEAIGYAVFKGMVAHIEGDLPRSLAEVYTDHVAPDCAYKALRADFLLMEPLFNIASEHFFAAIPAKVLGAKLRLCRLALPASLFSQMMRRPDERLRKLRLEAFERGRRLCAPPAPR